MRVGQLAELPPPGRTGPTRCRIGASAGDDATECLIEIAGAGTECGPPGKGAGVFVQSALAERVVLGDRRCQGGEMLVRFRPRRVRDDCVGEMADGVRTVALNKELETLG